MSGSDKSHVVQPNFINVGPGRCASSWQLEVLESHPQISMAKIKETEFFNTNFERGTEWYEGLFPQANKAVGEISNCYYTEPEVAERVREYNPEMRIMINVRNPFSLLNSFHQFGKRGGLPLENLADDLDFEIGRIMGSGYEARQRDGKLTAGDDVSLVDAVLLTKHLKPFFDCFPASQIYVFVFERLKTERAAVLREIYDFLGVDSDFVPEVADEVVNAAIEPKSKFVARFATRLAFGLRQVGAYRLLDNLKKSRVVKKAFYSQATDSKKIDPRSVLAPETCLQIESDMRKMMELYPPLKKWWEPLLTEAPSV